MIFVGVDVDFGDVFWKVDVLVFCGMNIFMLIVEGNKVFMLIYGGKFFMYNVICEGGIWECEMVWEIF